MSQEPRSTDRGTGSYLEPTFAARRQHPGGVIGIYGNVVEDHVLPNAAYSACGSLLEIASGSRVFRLHTCESEIPAGGKVTVPQLPSALLDGGNVRLGGGSANSYRAIARLAPDTAVRFVDTSDDPELVHRGLGAGRVEVRALGWRPVSRNAILGARDDKLVVRTATTPARDLSTDQRKVIEWLCGSGQVLVNSPKDVAAVLAIIELKPVRGFRLHYVVTPSLPATVLAGVVLPNVDVLYAGHDELVPLTGAKGAFDSLSWLRERAPQACVLLTLGKNGVLAAGPGGPVVHVRLRNDRLSQVQAQVRSSPTRVCGCGDAFAGGVFAAEVGLSWLSATPGLPYHAFLACCGCAASLRWLNHTDDLALSDFEVTAPTVERLAA